MTVLLRLYLTVRKSGWFVPSVTGGILPFLFAWQAWLIFAGFIVALTATIALPAEPAWIGRMVLCVIYIGLGMLTYDGT